MSERGAFSGFPHLGLVDRCADGVTYLLSNDPDGYLQAWTDGRIKRSRTFGPIKGWAAPHIAVAAVSLRSEFRPSNELYQLVPIAISIVWEELETEAEQDEPSVASVVDWIHKILHGTPYLDTPASSGERLTERLDSLEPVSLASRRAEGASLVTFLLQLEARYQVSLDTTSWNRYGS